MLRGCVDPMELERTQEVLLVSHRGEPLTTLSSHTAVPLLSGPTGKVLLRDYVNATVGFEALAQDMDKDPKSLMRMLSAKGNPRADNLLAMVSRLKQREGVSFSLTEGNQLDA